MMSLKMIGDVTLRMVATFTASALSIISGAAIVGDIPMHKAAFLAGFVAVAQVAEKLARASMDENLPRKRLTRRFWALASRGPRTRNPYTYDNLC